MAHPDRPQRRNIKERAKQKLVAATILDFSLQGQGLGDGKGRTVRHSQGGSGTSCCFTCTLAC